MFEWDDKKREDNIAKHRIDFLTAVLIFEGRDSNLFEIPQFKDGEERWLSIGLKHGSFLSVAWTWRGDKKRIISARRATKQEIQLWLENQT